MRTSGILMHITSLPGKYGVGTMGREAYKFVDFLKKAGQSYWQILPLTPTGYSDSPYQSCSTFAGNHYLIDLDTLVDEGLLTQDDLADITWNVTDDQADFGLLYQNRLRCCVPPTAASPPTRTTPASARKTATGCRTSPCSWP